MIKINRIIAGVLTLAAMMGSAVECRAVSDREMEEARAIAAKAYLRYANNGSGYLDEVNARSIAELQKSLKAKEKENIKAFLAIPVPKDYATWDKTKLVEYWGSTAFQAAGLIEEGKGARPRVRKQIMAMSVSAPSAAAPAETSAEAAPAPADAASAEASVAEQPAEAAAPDPAAQQADILADQKAIEDDAKNAAPESQNSGSNSTWIYVVILCVLIGVVVWLVTFAAKVMNRQPDAAGKNDDEAEEVRAKARQAIASYKEKLAAHEDVERELKAREQEHVRREQQLLARIADLEEKLRKAETRSYREPAGTPASAAPAASVQPKTAPEPEEILHVIYLGRANSRGIFVRADRRLSPGNTIYRLDTEDGLVGTFHVVDNPAVTAIALEHPLEMLSGGCSALDIEDTVGATSIVTESSGTAIFENGYWKVLRKSSIRYE